ncbi:MAG: hypothetical protein E7604_10560 [Ruminococcaceae bacterium]|nr:hypothetical protein [Oscillospiraceae bacterium]
MRWEDDGRLRSVRLTAEEIEQDLLLSQRSKRKRYWESFVCWSLFGEIGIILWLLSGRAWFLLLLAIPVGVLVWVLFHLVRLNREKRAILRGEYIVMRQKLVNIGRERVRETHISHIGRRAGISLYRTVECLYFKSQEWRFPKSCYAWCGQYCENSADFRGSFRETFVIGDAFYLVIPNSTYAIEAAYNVNYFSYDGVITE